MKHAWASLAFLLSTVSAMGVVDFTEDVDQAENTAETRVNHTEMENEIKVDEG